MEFARLLVLLHRLGLQGLDPCVVLTDLPGEPDRHILGLNLRLSLPLNFTSEVVHPLTGIVTLLLKPHYCLE
jgi:hypothetical protein